MKWLQGTWAMRFNRFRGECGRPFQGRFKAMHVEPGHALAQVAHYIHLNPVRAKIVTPERLRDYPRSSLPLFLAKPRPHVLEASTLLAECGGLSDDRHGWLSYLRYLSVLAAEDAADREAKFRKLTREWAIGSAGFKATLKRQLARAAAGEAFSLLGADRAAHQQVRQELWEDKLQEAAKLLRVSLERLPPLKSATMKVRLAAVLKAGTSVSNVWLATRLQMGQPDSVSQFVRRFRLAGGAASPWFQRALSAVRT